MRFTINGRSVEVDAARVERAVSSVQPEAVQKHAVRICGVLYPVKQVLEAATGIPRIEFTSQTASRVLGALGLEIAGSDASRAPAPAPGPAATVSPPPTLNGWPWEGNVQAVFASYLVGHGWSLTSLANTATKERGVDLLASKGARRLGAEVKGWPSLGYADPRRASEVKRTQPSTQAVHWFAQALLKALMLLDTDPTCESLVVLPDFARYRDLARRTRTGASRAGIHVVFAREDGTAESPTWTP